MNFPRNGNARRVAAGVIRAGGDDSASSVREGRELLAAGLDTSEQARLHHQAGPDESDEPEFKQELAQILEWFKTAPTANMGVSP